jgi:acetyltransferase
MEQQILAEARRVGMRIVGPNCLGVMSPLQKFNATFAADMARPGNLAFISQSGALCTAILDWSFKEHVGFSGFVSIGSMLDVGWGDLIYYFGDDRTRAASSATWNPSATRAPSSPPARSRARPNPSS